MLHGGLQASQWDGLAEKQNRRKEGWDGVREERERERDGRRKKGGSKNMRKNDFPHVLLIGGHQYQMEGLK